MLTTWGQSFNGDLVTHLNIKYKAVRAQKPIPTAQYKSIFWHKKFIKEFGCPQLKLPNRSTAATQQIAIEKGGDYHTSWKIPWTPTNTSSDKIASKLEVWVGINGQNDLHWDNHNFSLNWRSISMLIRIRWYLVCICVVKNSSARNCFLLN